MARGAPKKAKGVKSSFGDGAAKPATAEPGLPSFFEPVPRELQSIAKCLPKDHINVIHVEKTPASLRRKAFLVPVVLNAVITLVLLCRLYYALPIYLNQMTTILGYDTAWSVKTSELSAMELLKILAYRTLLLSFDYALFGLLGRWPYEFLFGDKYGRHVSCALWKWEVGFQRPQEFIVRRGRKWDLTIFTPAEVRAAEGKPKGGWTKEEELRVYTKCIAALAPAQTSKPALSLLDQDWDLDYSSMIDLTEFAVEGNLDSSKIDRTVFVPWQNRWFWWSPHRSTTEADEMAKSLHESDERVEQFKERLTAINCEDVFYRWIEIIQYETAQADRFSSDKKAKAEQELRTMIRDRGHDDEKLFEQLGGRSNIPGLGDNE